MDLIEDTQPPFSIRFTRGDGRVFRGFFFDVDGATPGAYTLIPYAVDVIGRIGQGEPRRIIIK